MAAGSDSNFAHSSSSSSSKAKARWGLLKAAVLKNYSATQQEQEASIHRFKGLQMIPKEPLERQKAKQVRLRLLQQARECISLEALQHILLLLQCCRDDPDDDECMEMEISTNIPKNWLQNDDGEAASLSALREKLALRGISYRISPSNNGTSTTLLHCRLPPSQEFTLFQYHVTPNLSVWTCERSPQQLRNKIRLQDLTSQQHHKGVDNTGNTCVWDSELTLAYCLIQSTIKNVHDDDDDDDRALKEWCGLWNDQQNISSSMTTPLRILELGAGMAGVAGLSLAALQQSTQQQQQQQQPRRPLHLTLTDGHPSAVYSNQVNQVLNELLWDYSATEHNHYLSIHCERLVWSDTLDPPPPFHHQDVCLASDCTHFEEFHGSLMLTLARILKIHGMAILCQPPRGKSLQRFVDVVKCVEGLWEVRLWDDHYDPRVHAKHVAMLQTDPHYDPNIHYPHVLVLKKLRHVTEHDRNIALEHVSSRQRT